MARLNRQNDAKDVAASLHAEIADRAARCLNDYLVPWRQFDAGYTQAKVTPPSWVSKFRPVDPIVYPAVASKLGLLPPDTLFSVVQFYFRLDAVRREIDDILGDESFATASSFDKVKRRLRRVTDRLHSSFGAARDALSRLDVANAATIEAAAARAYPYVQKQERPLREQLKANEPRPAQKGGDDGDAS